MMLGLRIRQTLRAGALAFFTALLLVTPARAGSETPPPGPPWMKDLVKAQKAALEKKVPIFVYLTKTY